MNKMLCVLLAIITATLLGCNPTQPTASPTALQPSPTVSLSFLKIDRYPPANAWNQGKLHWLPDYDLEAENPFQIDLRSADLSLLDLHTERSTIQYALFDSKTIWPADDRMPVDFDWTRMMEIGKNPGLGVRSLHAQGISGQGVSIAIIDQTLLIKHVEYTGRILLYEEDVSFSAQAASVHGPAVTSLAVGETTGVAPGANVFFFAVDVTDPDSTVSEFKRNFHTMAEAIRRVINLNRRLPDDMRIRAISISNGWNPNEIGYDDIRAAVEEASAAGILVVSGRMSQTYGYQLYWLGRSPDADPDSFDSYGLCELCAEVSPEDFAAVERILIPMDSRTVASFTGVEDYAFFRLGGGSWTMPYFTGVYALACQVDPGITPERFLQLAWETGRALEVGEGEQAFVLGKIVDPVALIEALMHD